MPIIHRQHFISSSSENLSGTDENYSLEGPRYSPTLKPKAYSESQPSDAPCSPPGFGRPPENCITPSDESDASQTSRYEEEDYLTVLVPTAKAREKSIPPNSDGSPSSQEQPSKQQSNAKTEKLARRQALQTKVDEELLRVEEALALFRKRVTYEASSLAGWQRFEAELEEESEVLLNNLLWLYKKENGITNLGLNLEVILEEHIGSGDEAVRQELPRTREPLGNSFIPTNDLQGFFPELLEEINERYSVIMGNTGDDNSTLDPRLDLAISPPNYTFTDIRKELGLYKRSGVRKRELDKTWKVLRRKVQDEIASENLRDIRKTIEPDRLHSETLRIARKMLNQQEPWNEVSASQKKLEKLAYALVCREYCIVGEKAAGFGCDKNPAKRPVKDRKAKSQVKITPAVKSPSKRGRNSIRKETTYVRSDIFPEDSSDSVYDYNDHKRLRRSRRCAAARLTTRSPTAEATDEHEDNTDSPNSSFTMNSYPKMPSGASAKSSAGKKGTIYNDIPLVQRKDVVEIKRMELEAEEMWLAVFEKKEAFKKKYGVSYNYAF